MANHARAPIELPTDLQAFAEERVRAGEYTSVEAVVFDALEKQRLAALRDALDAGIAKLDAGRGEATSTAAIMDEVSAELSPPVREALELISARLRADFELFKERLSRAKTDVSSGKPAEVKHVAKATRVAASNAKKRRLRRHATEAGSTDRRQAVAPPKRVAKRKPRSR
jgi:Arc/MetJ-type ribon-helix-helix transcriptional regulator